jgi:hypothetical protein
MSFPAEDENAKEAAERIHNLIDEYDESVKNGAIEFRTAESEFAARTFRFPDRINRLVEAATKSLSEFGQLVNNGVFEKADLQLARFRDDYAQIVKEGRGWRLSDPFEGIKKWFKRDRIPPEKADKYGLTLKDVNEILELVHKRATSQRQNTFAVHPPKKLLDRPEIVRSENIVAELENSVFNVVFQDGANRMMTLAELIFFTFNLIFMRQQMIEIGEMLRSMPSQGPTEVKVTFPMSGDWLMRPEMVRTLLDKIEFSELPCDGSPFRTAA